MPDIAEIVDRLRSIDDDLSDAALERLRSSIDGETSAASEEKTITRARRAVEKAIHLLDSPSTKEHF